MDKFGRKRRVDPVQESIVAKKDQLNERAKQLIALWIETKRGWNGRPAPGIGLQERGDIKLPLPDQIQQAAKAIDTRTNELLSLLSDVMREQAAYSQTRRKSRKELPVVPETPAAPPTTAERDFELRKLATDGIIIEAGSLSRFMAHLKSPFQFGDKKRSQRLRMLRFAAKIFYLTKDIENDALSEKNVNKIVYQIKNLYYLLKTNIIDLIMQDMKNESVFRPYPSLSSEYSERRRVRERDDKKPENLPINKDLLAEYDSLVLDVEQIEKDQQISQKAQKLITAFRSAKNSHDIQRMRDIHSELMAEYKDENIKKNAHNLMSRWLRRQRMSMRETQEASLRLKIDKGMRDSRISLEKLMKILEQSGEFSSNSIDSLVDICKSLIPVFQATTVLAETYNNSIELYGRDKNNRPISHSEVYELQNMAGILYEDMMELKSAKVINE